MNTKFPLRFLSERARNVLWILLVGIIYFLPARISLQLAFQSSNATPVWPPSGFAFAAILLLGQRIAPGILLGAFAANLVTFLNNDTIDTFTATWVSLLISLGNTAEALVGNYLLKKFIPGKRDNNY